MSKINCEVACDLIPLYVDKVLSPSSVELVEEHLAECGDCRDKANLLTKDTVVKSYDDSKPLKKFKNKLTGHKIITSIVVAFCVITLVIIFLNTYHHDYTYDEVADEIEVVSESDGHVYFVYNGDKIFLTKALYNVIGEENGKLQVAVSFYLTVDANELYLYYFAKADATKELIDEGYKRAVYVLCPNTPNEEYGSFGCDICIDKFVVSLEQFGYDKDYEIVQIDYCMFDESKGQLVGKKSTTLWEKY